MLRHYTLIISPLLPECQLVKRIPFLLLLLTQHPDQYQQIRTSTDFHMAKLGAVRVIAAHLSILIEDHFLLAEDHFL